MVELKSKMTNRRVESGALEIIELGWDFHVQPPITTPDAAKERGQKGEQKYGSA